MTHRLLILVSLALLRLCWPTGAAANDPQPNIVLFIADDLTYWDLGAYGGQAKTPHIDRLAREGMKFANSYQAVAVCAPTRMNLYTGIYPVKSGAYPQGSFVKPGTKSIAHYLQELGYRTALAGKRHIQPPEAFPFEQIGPDRGGLEW